MNKKTILSLGSLLCIIFIVGISFNKTRNSELPRNAKWDMRQNLVVKKEQKKNKDIYISEKIVTLQNIEIFNDTADYFYYKFEDGKLNEIVIWFYTSGSPFFKRISEYNVPDLERFDRIAEEIEKGLGKSVFSEANSLWAEKKWSTKNTYVEMRYHYSDDFIELTYKKQ